MKFYLIYKNHGLYDPVLDDQEPIFQPIEPEDFDQPFQTSEVQSQIPEFSGTPNFTESRSLTASPFVPITKPYRPFSTEPLVDIPPLEDPLILNPDYHDNFNTEGFQESSLSDTKFKLPISEQYDPDGKRKKMRLQESSFEKENMTTSEVQHMEKMNKDMEQIDITQIELTATSLVDSGIQNAIKVTNEIQEEIYKQLNESSDVTMIMEESKFNAHADINEYKETEKNSVSGSESMDKLENILQEARGSLTLKDELNQVKDFVIQTTESFEFDSNVNKGYDEKKVEQSEGNIELDQSIEKPDTVKSNAKKVLNENIVRLQSSSEDCLRSFNSETVIHDESQKSSKCQTSQVSGNKIDEKHSTSRLLAEQRAYTIGLQTIPNIKGSIHSSYHYNLLLKTFFIHLTDVMVALSRFILTEPVGLKSLEQTNEIKTNIDQCTMKEAKLSNILNSEVQDKYVENLINEHKSNTFQNKTHLTEKKIISGAKMAQLSERKTEHLTGKMNAVISEFQSKAGIEDVKMTNELVLERSQRSSSRSKIEEEVLQESDPLEWLSKKDSTYIKTQFEEESIANAMETVNTDYIQKRKEIENNVKVSNFKNDNKGKNTYIAIVEAHVYTNKNAILDEAMNTTSSESIEETNISDICNTKASEKYLKNTEIKGCTSETISRNTEEIIGHKEIESREDKTKFYERDIQDIRFQDIQNSLEDNSNKFQGTEETKHKEERNITDNVSIICESKNDYKQDETIATPITENNDATVIAVDSIFNKTIKNNIECIDQSKEVEENRINFETNDNAELKLVKQEDNEIKCTPLTKIIENNIETEIYAESKLIEQESYEETNFAELEKIEMSKSDHELIDRQENLQHEIQEVIQESSCNVVSAVSSHTTESNLIEQVNYEETNFTELQKIEMSKSDYQLIDKQENLRHKTQEIIQESECSAISVGSSHTKLKRLSLQTDLKSQNQLFESHVSVQSDDNNDIDTPSPSTVPPTPLTDEYIFRLEIPLPKSARGTTPIPLPQSPEVILHDEDPHIVKKKLIPHIETTIERIVYDPPLPTPPPVESLCSSDWMQSELKLNEDAPLILSKDDILEIERRSSLLASAIDETIKSIEEYKESVGLATRTEVKVKDKVAFEEKEMKVIDEEYANEEESMNINKEIYYNSFSKAESKLYDSVKSENRDINLEWDGIKQQIKQNNEDIFRVSSKGSTRTEVNNTMKNNSTDISINIATDINEQSLKSPEKVETFNISMEKSVIHDIKSIEQTENVSAVDQTYERYSAMDETELQVRIQRQDQNNTSKTEQLTNSSTDNYDNSRKSSEKTESFNISMENIGTHDTKSTVQIEDTSNVTTVHQTYESCNGFDETEFQSLMQKQDQSSMSKSDLFTYSATDINDESIKLCEKLENINISMDKTEAQDTKITMQVKNSSDIKTIDHSKEGYDGLDKIEHQVRIQNQDQQLQSIEEKGFINKQELIKMETQESKGNELNENGEIIGTTKGIVDGLEEIVIDEEIAKVLGKPGITEEKIAELISGESEMLREAHVMGLSRVLTSHMHRTIDDDSSVDFNKIKPVVDSLKDSEVLKVLNEELAKSKEEKKKEERKWTTFLQKPKRPVPRAKFGYYRYTELEEETEEKLQEPYKVKIVKQPKPKVAPDYKPEDFETGPLPWEERALREPSPPPVEPEDPILVPEEGPEFLEAVDPLPENEIPDLEETDIPLPLENPDQEEFISDEAQIVEENKEEIQLEENSEIEPVVEDTKEIEDNMEQNKLAEQLMRNIQSVVDPNASLEQQLAQMRVQLAALAQLPGVIQQTLELVTKQLTHMGHQETNHSESESCVKQETQEESKVTEIHTETIEENRIEERHEESIANEISEENKIEELKTTQEALEKLKREEHEVIEEQRRIENQKREMMEQLRLEQESRQVKQRPTSRVGKPKPAFGPLTPQERPVVLPGGRKWRRPKDAYNDQFIAETLTAQAELIQGKVKGINFMKYEKPPVALDHLQNSEVYKLIHNMEPSPMKRVELLTPVIAEADYREKCRSITPSQERMITEQHLDIPEQVQP